MIVVGPGPSLQEAAEERPSELRRRVEAKIRSIDLIEQFLAESSAEAS